MNKLLKPILTVFLFLLLFGCGSNNDSVTPASEFVNGASLLGLVNGRTINYLQTDTVISIEPFKIDIITTNQTIKITGSGDDWIIQDNDQLLINLKVTTTSVIQNGYWRKVNAQDSIFYFAAPPVLMMRSLTKSIDWDDFTPFYKTDTSQEMLPFYYSYFGFNYTKEFIGIEEIITPAGAFNAYRFDVSLFVNFNDVSPIATVSEFYAPNIGLVKLNFSSGPLRRSLTMISYIDTVG